MNWLGIPFLSSAATFVLLTATTLAAQPDSAAKASPASRLPPVYPTNSRYVTDSTKGSDGSLKAVYPSASATNVVRLQGNSFYDGDGPFLGLGASYFQALHDTKYNRPRLNHNLALLASKGFNYVRVLSMVSWDGLEIAPVTFTNRFRREVPGWPDYWQQIRDLLDLAGQYGLRVEVTIFADAQHVMPDRSVRLAHLDGILANIAGREDHLMHLEVANEAWQNGFPGTESVKDLRAFTQHLADRTPVLVAVTSNDDTSDQGIISLYQGSAADLATVHFSRDTRTAEGGWLPVRDSYRAGRLPGVPPVTSNEPIGPGSSVGAESDPIKLCSAAAFAYLANLPGYVFHSRAGIYGYEKCCPPGGSELRFQDSAGIDAFLHLRQILPPDLPSWTRNDGLEPSAPFTVFCNGQPNHYWRDANRATNGCVRNIGSKNGDQFVTLPMGILGGGVTLEARRAVRFEVLNPLTGELVTNLALNAGKAFTLPQGPGAYIIKGSLTQVNSRLEWPDKAWAKVPPAEAGLDEARLAQARDYALTGGGSGCIIRGGKLVFSWGDPKQRYDLKSTTKSFGAAALGLAIKDGKVRLSDKARAHHPTLGTPPDSNADTGWLDEITILHLASQTAGFDKPGGYEPLLFKPGTEWAYSDSGPNWLAECITLAYRRDLDELMFERIFTPLGITRSDLDWRKNAYRPELIEGFKRREFGAGISANVDAMARFGLLWLCGGEWNGAQILTRDYVDTVRTTVSGVPGLQVRVPEDYGRAANHYGLLWWNNADETIKGLSPDAYWTWGLYDSLIVVMPTLDIVVARAGQSWKRAKDADHYEVLKPFLLPIVAAAGAKPVPHAKPLRIVIETDAGGDPDDEQSLVRFLVYANEFDVEGIIANRPVARDGENQNPVRDGLGIVRAQVKVYGECHANLILHDPRFPTADQLLSRTVAGYDDTDDGVKLILQAVDADDPRPVWFSNWGTDTGSAVSCLKRALDRVLRERGPEGYAKFKRRLRLSSYDKFDEHTKTLKPPFPLWVDTFRPAIDNKRWYHRFSALTATAGGFDLERDVRTGHGPLGALYPANTGLRQKEGDTMAFLYLVPTGMNDPNEPAWGSWAGRYGPNEEWPGKPYFWANQADTWRGTTSRDHTLARWATDVQNDFRGRLNWCVANDFKKANHHPIAALNHLPGSEILRLDTRAGAVVELNAAGSSDPDGNTLTTEWFIYGEAGTYRGEISLSATDGWATRFIAPDVKKSETIHVILRVSDNGQPPLCNYRRAIVAIRP